MKSIYKYDAPVDDRLVIRMPVGAKILTVQLQHGEPMIWALVDTGTDELEDRVLHVRGTGHDAENLGPYIGSIQMKNGYLVFHYFESVKE